MAERRTILISGGGIAGLTAALCIAKQGFRVQVFERDDLSSVYGAGIQISPNGMQVIEKLGLSKQMISAGFAPESILLRSSMSGKTLSRFETGQTIRSRHRNPYLQFHRADLINILAGACQENPEIEVHQYSEVQDHAVHANGLTALVNNQGRMHEYMGSLLIAADGVWSKTRSRMTNSTDARFSGDVAWRGLIAERDIPTGTDMKNTHLWLGKDAHLVLYPLRQGQYLNVVAITRGNEKELTRGWNTGQGQAAQMVHFESWPDEVNTILNAPGKWGGWPLYAVAPTGKWTSDRLVLIGDAAHAALPYAAQGGCSAIEDAWVLARCLGKERNNPQSAIEHYVNIRRPRVKKLVALAQTNRRIYHMSGIAQEFRDLFLPRFSQNRLQSRLDWVYGWKAETD